MENKEKIVWHYTKMNVLEKIFPPIFIKNGEENKEYNKDKITFRFTGDKFSKDPSECLILNEFFKINKENILKNLDSGCRKKVNQEQFRNGLSDSVYSYVFSTTHLKDSFAFWSKDYAGNDGISIGIKWDSIRNDKSSDKSTNMLFGDVGYVYPDLKIDPTDNLIKETANNLNTSYIIFNELIKDNAYSRKPNTVLDIFTDFFSNWYKHKSWEHEKEARITAHDNCLDLKTEFNDNKIKKVGYKTFNKSIVSSIILGPDCDNEQVKAVEDYLVDNGYNNKNDPNNIKVDRSKALDLKYMYFLDIDKVLREREKR